MGPLEDETLPIGAYGVVAGVTLHLAMRDPEAARLRMRLRREARERVRAAQAEVRAAKARREARAQAAHLEEVREARQSWWWPQWLPAAWFRPAQRAFGPGAACLGTVLLVYYLAPRIRPKGLVATLRAAREAARPVSREARFARWAREEMARNNAENEALGVVLGVLALSGGLCAMFPESIGRRLLRTVVWVLKHVDAAMDPPAPARRRRRGLMER